MATHSYETCPRCGEGRLKTWRDLNDEEQIIALRLPGHASYSPRERKTKHRWCTLCWYEEAQGARHDA